MILWNLSKYRISKIISKITHLSHYIMSVGFAMKASLSGCFPSKVVAFRGTNCVTSQEEAVHGGGGSRNLISEENLCGQYQE